MDDSVFEPWWEIWYLLVCPVVGIKSLEVAKERAKEWKRELHDKFQPVIIGETDRDFECVSCDCLFRISVLGNLDACEMEFPDVLLEEKNTGG